MGSVETKHIAGGSLRGTGNDAGQNGDPLLLVILHLTQTQNLRRPIEESREQQRRLPARSIASGRWPSCSNLRSILFGTTQFAWT
jgi:hypothetical protein